LVRYARRYAAKASPAEEFPLETGMELRTAPPSSP
jgi:hypothetical protein